MSWILTNRKTNKSRTFKTLETGRKAAIQASAKYGVRYVFLRPKPEKTRAEHATGGAEGGDKCKSTRKDRRMSTPSNPP